MSNAAVAAFRHHWIGISIAQSQEGARSKNGNVAVRIALKLAILNDDIFNRSVIVDQEQTLDTLLASRIGVKVRTPVIAEAHACNLRELAGIVAGITSADTVFNQRAEVIGP